MLTLKLTPIYHRNRVCVLLNFPFNDKVVRTCQSWDKCHWSSSYRCWYLIYFPFIEKEIYDRFSELIKVDYRHLVRDVGNLPVKRTQKQVSQKEIKLTDEHDILLSQFESYLKSRRYSNNTINNYSEVLQTFFRFFPGDSPSLLTQEHVSQFNYQFIIGNNYSRSYQNAVTSALKLFYSKVLNAEIDADKLERPMKDRRLPTILSAQEVQRLLDTIRNQKHLCMLSLIYSCGLRCGDLLGIRVRDLDSDRMLIHIKKGKGQKDRIVPLPKSMLEPLREYYKEYKPTEFLFEGMNGGKYSASSLQKILRKALYFARIHKEVTLHTLRHSYATHLLEAGVNLRYIQEILGHNSPKTTQIYTHVSSLKLQEIESPIDKLNLNFKKNK